MPDLTTTRAAVELMSSSKNEEEWNENCDAVKRANNGDYPSWWYAEIIMSGVYSSTSKNWK